MKKSVFLGLFMFIFILQVSNAAAISEHTYQLKLLAVQEVEGGYQGSDADLYLELTPGSGRVFLETYPLTKLDTQISTRFAKDIACNHFNLDCNKYDFFYTIKAKSSIIGGPSAGAAISALTAIAVMDLDYDQNIAVTGTINSGGIVGPIDSNDEGYENNSSITGNESIKKNGYIKKGPLDNSSKIGGSYDIPSNISSNISSRMNQTNILAHYQENLSLEVVEVIDLDEVLFHLTGKEFNGEVHEIEVNHEYSTIMGHLQELLCDRTLKLTEELESEHFILNESLLRDIKAKEEAAQNSTLQGDYYSAASFCFGNNINLKTIYYRQKKVGRPSYERLFRELEQKSLALEREVDALAIDTISSLQAYMVVKERLSDVKEQVQKFRNNATLEESAELLAYSEERYFSALSWKAFFAMNGKKFVVDQERLKNSCVQKISEAEERYQYVGLFLGEGNLFRIREKMRSAKEALDANEPALCLITASQAKADANAILSSFGLVDENLDKFLDSKKKAVERVIYDNNKEGIFPILGYSYYQYGNSLREEKFNTLVYFEYALEMSDLSMYFPEEKNYFVRVEEFNFDEKWAYLLAGFLLGLVVMWVVRKKK
ncbi:hypothetical protein HYT52_04510 [Candidatus Woesearchaeota archaeon]|nr:hypothetical protein [Candidatus Woesearchaeota archaeon]